MRVWPTAIDSRQDITSPPHTHKTAPPRPARTLPRLIGTVGHRIRIAFAGRLPEGSHGKQIGVDVE